MKGKFFKKGLKQFTQNTVLLYVLLALTIVNLLNYLAENNLAAILTFLLVGFGTTYVTKNMVHVLLVAILLTNFLNYVGFLKKIGIREGATGVGDDHEHNHRVIHDKKESKDSRALKYAEDELKHAEGRLQLDEGRLQYDKYAFNRCEDSLTDCKYNLLQSNKSILNNGCISKDKLEYLYNRLDNTSRQKVHHFVHQWWDDLNIACPSNSKFKHKKLEK